VLGNVEQKEAAKIFIEDKLKKEGHFESVNVPNDIIRMMIGKRKINFYELKEVIEKYEEDYERQVREYEEYEKEHIVSSVCMPPEMGLNEDGNMDFVDLTEIDESYFIFTLCDKRL